MPKFTVLSRKDAFVDYVAEVEADTPEAAVDLAYEGRQEIKWRSAERSSSTRAMSSLLTMKAERSSARHVAISLRPDRAISVAEMSGDDKPWANLGLGEAEQALFRSASQNARIWTEGWVARSLFCPNCGAATISQFPANRQVADFECHGCREEFELKAQRSRFGAKVMDGAYGAKMQRLAADNNPNLMVMRYDRARMSVTDLLVVPKHFFTADLIEPRRPLSATARRAGGRGRISASMQFRYRARSLSCATAFSSRKTWC